jgi:hypothetical protein
MGKKYYYTLKVYLIVTMKIPHHTNLIFGPKDLAGIEGNFSSHIFGQIFLIDWEERQIFQIS